MSKSRKSIFLLAGILLLLVIFTVGCAKKSDTTTTSTPASSGTTTTEQSKGEATKTAAPAGNEVANSCATSCHEMWPEVTTWQTGVHAKVSCETCHQGAKADDYKAAHDGGFAKPIAVKKPVPNEACTGCHAMDNRDATPIPDIKIPHDRHNKANVECLSCHRFVAHGNLGERKVTTRAQFANYDQWNTQLAKQAAPGVMRRPNMFVCINCHSARKVTVACAACHYYPDRASLPSHENPEWKAIHGKTGRQDVDNCSKCHYDKESQKFATPSTGDKIADFARANSYCYGCHLKRPYNHDANWMGKHPQMAASKQLANCFACHDKDQPRQNVTGTYCNTCHWFKDGAPNAAPKK